MVAPVDYTYDDFRACRAQCFFTLWSTVTPLLDLFWIYCTTCSYIVMQQLAK